MGRVRLGAAALLLAVGLVACVDHDGNAREFCDRHAEVISAEIDNAQLDLSPDELRDVEDDLEETMRDAEDGTRPVRLAARDLVDGYRELADLVDDDEAEPGEVDDARTELDEVREEMRDACRAVESGS
ncbi:MAG: hypothetical protein SGJ13_12680 [Actinomycetota bacterium]|nr:hypothetical protein [Actinomycetota bacterium]